MALSVRNAGMVANAVLSNNTTEYSPIIISPEDRETLLSRLPDDVREMVRNVPNLFDYESVLATVIEYKMPGTVVLVSETVQGKIRHVPYFAMTSIATALGYRHVPVAVENIKEHVVPYESIRNSAVGNSYSRPNFRPNQSFATYKGVMKLIARVSERHREQANQLEKIVDSIHELTRDIAETLYRFKMEYDSVQKNIVIHQQKDKIDVLSEQIAKQTEKIDQLLKYGESADKKLNMLVPRIAPPMCNPGKENTFTLLRLNPKTFYMIRRQECSKATSVRSIQLKYYKHPITPNTTGDEVYSDTEEDNDITEEEKRRRKRDTLRKAIIAIPVILEFEMQANSVKFGIYIRDWFDKTVIKVNKNIIRVPHKSISKEFTHGRYDEIYLIRAIEQMRDECKDIE